MTPAKLRNVVEIDTANETMKHQNLPNKIGIMIKQRQNAIENLCSPKKDFQ